MQIDIALALHAERRNAVARDLRQERTRNALDRKSERGVLRGALVPHAGQLLYKFAAFFLRQAVEQIVDVRVRIAQLCRGRHHFFRFRRVGDQSYFHLGSPSVFLFCALVGSYWMSAAVFCKPFVL